MDAGSFAEYLSGLDEESLTQLLRARPDVRVEPVPRGFGQLAQRLGGADSLVAALWRLNRDEVIVGQAIAALASGAAATVPGVARLLGAADGPVVDSVRECVTQLCARGLTWVDGGSGTLCLPERLAAHWAAEIGSGRPVRRIATAVRVDDLRPTAEALGVPAAGLRKSDLVARLAERMADAQSLAAVVAALPEPARTRLDELRRGSVADPFGHDSQYGHYAGYRSGYGSSHSGGIRRIDDPTELLVRAGLVLRVNGYHPELPREVAVAAWLAECAPALPGPPHVPAAAVVDAAAVRSAAQAAAQDALRSVTTLLDHAAANPVVALKKGGIGARERRRLTTRLSIAEDVLVLWIDLAHVAGLLGQTDSGYVPTDGYQAWRDGGPGAQWAALARAWFGLEHAPLSREVDGDKEQPPPLPLVSGAGRMRRALLLAASPGLSVRGVGEQIDWFCPLHGYDVAGGASKVAAAIREAELLGVVAAGRLTELGEHLLATAADPDGAETDGATDGATNGATDTVTDGANAELARRCAPLLPEARCTVILQSDLTAVVAGRPSAAVARLLAAAAVSEARGTAAVWRFTPASVRAALDAGWDAQDLLAELKAASDCALPQPLEYLINDVARRHGHVRVRGMRSCLLADEATITEILHTRSLARLHLSRLAPTVASSPFELDEVLVRLRVAGLSPVAEDALGAVIVEAKPEHRASPAHHALMAPRPRSRLGAAELARLLVADPHDKRPRASDASDTFAALTQLNPHLDEAELELLADAVDRRGDILIAYRDKNGSRTVRHIRPQQIYGSWLDAWCHLRDAQRDFTIANIESVAPA